MKKLLLLSSLLLGAIPASQAGVSFNVGIGLPLPVPLPFINIRPAPVYVPVPPVCVPAPVWGAPGRVVIAPPPYYRYPYPHRHGYLVHRGWEHPYGCR